MSDNKELLEQFEEWRKAKEASALSPEAAKEQQYKKYDDSRRNFLVVGLLVSAVLMYVTYAVSTRFSMVAYLVSSAESLLFIVWAIDQWFFPDYPLYRRMCENEELMGKIFGNIIIAISILFFACLSSPIIYSTFAALVEKPIAEERSNGYNNSGGSSQSGASRNSAPSGTDGSSQPAPTGNP